MRIIKWLDEYFEETILVIFLVAITVVMMAQIIARAAGSSMSWPEEFCRLAWIWSVFLSLPYTIKKGNMLRVNVLIDLFPHVLRKSFFILADLIIIGVMALFFKQSFVTMASYVKTASVTPAMLIPTWIGYGIVIIAGFGLGTIRGIETLIRDIMRFNVRDLTTKEQTMKDAEEEAAAASRDAAPVGGEA